MCERNKIYSFENLKKKRKSNQITQFRPFERKISKFTINYFEMVFFGVPQKCPHCGSCFRWCELRHGDDGNKIEAKFEKLIARWRALLTSLGVCGFFECFKWRRPNQRCNDEKANETSPVQAHHNSCYVTFVATFIVGNITIYLFMCIARTHSSSANEWKCIFPHFVRSIYFCSLFSLSFYKIELAGTYRSPYVASPNDVTFSDSAPKLLDRFSTIRFTIFA